MLWNCFSKASITGIGPKSATLATNGGAILVDECGADGAECGCSVGVGMKTFGSLFSGGCWATPPAAGSSLTGRCRWMW